MNHGLPEKRNGGRRKNRALRFRIWRGAIFALGLAGASVQVRAQSPSTSAEVGAGVILPANESSADLLQKASDDAAQGNLDKALPEVDYALQIDPRNTSAYELRGSIYIQKKLWNLAVQDYSSALAIDPSSAVFKYKLAEIKFIQRDYANARPGFAALQNDPAVGDLSSYRVFLCDLLDDHLDRATKDLAAMKAGGNPAYYYDNATWFLYHQNSKEAQKWLSEADYLFDASKLKPYISTLVEAENVHYPTVTFVTKNGDKYDRVSAFLENGTLHIRNPQGNWIVIPSDQLPDDLSNFPAEWRKQIETQRESASDAANSADLVSFTTRQGKHYDQVKWLVDDAGFFVLTSDGWLPIPFSQLPDDLSRFPVDAQKQISEERHAFPEAAGDRPLLSFTSKQGTRYDQVKWLVDNTGLSILTSDGWTLIPFSQLPDVLPHFPREAWKEIDEERRAFPNASPDRPLLSLTTRQGRHYDQVKWLVNNRGLVVLTSDGWTQIPFDQLPDDLSHFPPDARNQIASARAAPKAPPENPRLTFVIKKGTHYDQVRWSLGDTGLFVLTTEGWILVPFDQLTNDLSHFPPDARNQIVEKRRAAPQTPFEKPPLTFVTKQGTRYDQVKWSLGDTGLFILTTEGWILVPFDQLTNDLSHFPATVREQISLKRSALASPPKSTAAPVNQPK